MSDEMTGEVPFSNEEILTKATESRDEFYRTHFAVLEKMSPKAPPSEQPVTAPKKPE